MSPIAFMTSYAVLCLMLLSSLVMANPNKNKHHHVGHGSVVAPSPAGYAPFWDLSDAQNRMVSSDDFAGQPYVLVLHRGDGCLHCAEQLISLGKFTKQFQQAGASIVAVSDDDPAELRTQLDSFGDGFPLDHFICDPTRGLFEQFGATDSKADSKSEQTLHGTFLIDGSGRVRWSNVGQHPFMEFGNLLEEVSLVSSGATTLQEDSQPKAPVINLDRSERVVNFQLRRLSNEELLRVPRKTDNEKYAPVFQAILIRDGMKFGQRKDALTALAVVRKSNSVTELIVAMDQLKSKTGDQTNLALARLLPRLDVAQLERSATQLLSATTSANSSLRRAAYASLVQIGQSAQILAQIDGDESKTIDWLRSVALVPDRSIRNSLQGAVVAALSSSNSVDVRRAAISSLMHFSADANASFERLAELLKDRQLSEEVVQTMSAMVKLSDLQPSPKVCRTVIETLVARCEAALPDQRNQDRFVLAMQLSDELLTHLSDNDSKSYRDRMNAISVRVVRLLTVKEEMRYDRPWFAAEAGRPLQLVLQNKDLMPHNLVICQPGTLQQVAMDGLAVGPKGGADGKQYVPKTKDVLFATNMVQANQSGRLTFEVPQQPGEYPFVCTFPQHWSRMYGVMVVVEDLDAWMQNPKEPADPIGNTRKLVENWTIDDFSGSLDTDLADRSIESGKQIFTSATCAQCHKLGRSGEALGNVGPALDGVYARWKGDRTAVLRAILEPSADIDENYVMHTIATDDGMIRSGIIVKRSDQQIEIVENATGAAPVKIAVDEIENMSKSSTSIMPKALMDNYTKDEILDLLRYLESMQKK